MLVLGSFQSLIYRKLHYIGLFWQFSANSIQLELPVFEVFGILAWVFSRFCFSFEFFSWVFGNISKKVQIFSNFWKYLMIKRLFLGVPLSFPPKNWVFIQFSTNSTQLELPTSEVFFGIFKKYIMHVFSNFWKYLMIKRLY